MIRSMQPLHLMRPATPPVGEGDLDQAAFAVTSRAMNSKIHRRCLQPVRRERDLSSIWEVAVTAYNRINASTRKALRRNWW